MWKWILGVPAGLFAIVMVFGTAVNNSPEGQARSRDRQAIALCWQEQGRKSIEPGVARFVAGACERMESDFSSKWGVKP